MSKPRLVTGFQISFPCIDPDQVDHLKVLRGVSRKIWEFHLPYCESTNRRKWVLVATPDLSKELNNPLHSGSQEEVWQGWRLQGQGIALYQCARKKQRLKEF